MVRNIAPACTQRLGDASAAIHLNGAEDERLVAIWPRSAEP
jgi:hypothetical protein